MFIWPNSAMCCEWSEWAIQKCRYVKWLLTKLFSRMFLKWLVVGYVLTPRYFCQKIIAIIRTYELIQNHHHSFCTDKMTMLLQPKAAKQSGFLPRCHFIYFFFRRQIWSDFMELKWLFEMFVQHATYNSHKNTTRKQPLNSQWWHINIYNLANAENCPLFIVLDCIECARRGDFCV